MRFSRRTLVALSRLIAETRPHSSLTSLAYELGVEVDVPAEGNREARSLALARALERRCVDAGDDRAIRQLVEKTLGELTEYQRANAPHLPAVQAALALDGFELVGGALVTRTPGPAALAPQLSALERSLDVRGLAGAATHYGRAIEALGRGEPDAVNEHVRSFLESLFLSFAETMGGERVQDAPAALRSLADRGSLEPAEASTCRALWEWCGSAGPHPGVSAIEEALYRFNVATVLGRYLLFRLR